MITAILAFFAGDCVLQLFPELPSFILVISVLALTTLFVRLTTIPFAFTLGFCWSLWCAMQCLSWTLAKDQENKPLLVTGYISSLPVNQQFSPKFLFTLEHSTTQLSLNNQTNLNMHPGDKWQLRVRLKRIHGIRSSGAFDYEAWALQRGIRAAGYVLESTESQLLDSTWYHYPILRIRAYIKSKLDLTNLNPWLMALMLGEREGVSQDDWKVLRRTGTNHLMAIAGLHIGIAALFLHSITLWIWRRTPAVLLIPAQHAGAIAALIAALIYSALSGFSLPSERACLMLGIYIYNLLRRTQSNSWNVWALTLLIILLFNPLSVLSQNFWLSLGTIALIIYGMHGRLAPVGAWWRWGRVQWVIAVGLIPLSLLFYQEFSLVSFIANCIAIPWLSMILPLCLLSMVCVFIYAPFSHMLLLCAHKLLTGLWAFLYWCSSLPATSLVQPIPDYMIFILVLLTILLWLTPAGFAGKGFGLIWLLPLFNSAAPRPEAGDIILSILDVGQGLSAVVQTSEHLLVYDTGPGPPVFMDMGESVIIPYLHSISAAKIDMLVISHGDNDHIGGAHSLLQAFTAGAIKTSVVNKIKTPVSSYCLYGDKWIWDGVTFEFIYPYHKPTRAKNDDSCVLRIDNGKTVILLPGDIEKFAEKELLRHDARLKTDILIAPHHGSKTSSLPAFIAAVSPSIVIYADGYLNRYHLPNENVIAAFNALNAQQFNTVSAGTIIISITKTDLKVECYRILYRHYWNS